MAELVDTNSASAKASDILQGKTAYVKNGLAEGTIPVQEGRWVIKPGTSSVTAIERGNYMVNEVVMKGEPNLVPENIVKGVTMFGVKGTWEGEPPPPTLPEGFYEVNVNPDPPEVKLAYNKGVASIGMTVTAVVERDEEDSEFTPDRFEYVELRENGKKLTDDNYYKFKVSESRNFTAVFNGPKYPVDGVKWSESNKIPYSSAWNSIAYGDNKFILTSNNSKTYAYSIDNGTTWNVLSTLPITGLSVKYSNSGRFLVSSGSGACYSTTGLSWTQIPTSGTVSSMIDIACDSIWFYCIYNGQIHYRQISGSYAGQTTWSLYSNLPSGDWSLLLYTNSLQLYAFSSSKAAYQTSSGSSNAYSAEPLPFSASWACAKELNGSCFLVAKGDNRIARSTYIGRDQWETITAPFPVNDITYGDGKYVVVSYESNQAAYSADLVNWKVFDLPYNEPSSGVAYGYNRFVATTYNVDSAYSITESIWRLNSNSLPSIISRTKLVYGNNRFLCISAYNRKAIYSSDGITWGGNPLDNINARTISDMAYGNGKFIILARTDTSSLYPAFYSSTDGLNWELVSSLPSSNHLTISFAGDKFFLSYTSVYASAASYYSQDGVSWKSFSFPVAGQWNKFAFGSGKYVAIDVLYGNVASSIDGISWTSVITPIAPVDVAYGNGKFVIVGSSNTIAYSENGLSWKTVSLPAKATVNLITFAKSKFFAIQSESNKMVYSEDGIIWGVSKMPSTQQWNSLAYGDGTVVAIATNSEIAALSYDS